MHLLIGHLRMKRHQQPQIARAQMAQQIRQRRLAALKGHDGLVQVIQGNGDFHNLIGVVVTSLISFAAQRNRVATDNSPRF